MKEPLSIDDLDKMCEGDSGFQMISFLQEIWAHSDSAPLSVRSADCWTDFQRMEEIDRRITWMGDSGRCRAGGELGGVGRSRQRRRRRSRRRKAPHWLNRRGSRHRRRWRACRWSWVRLLISLPVNRFTGKKLLPACAGKKNIYGKKNLGRKGTFYQFLAWICLKISFSMESRQLVS